MDILSILTIAVIGLILIFFMLVSVLAIIMAKYGILYTQPQYVWVVLNLITGKLVEKFPGLSLIIPGIHKKIREVSCLPHVMGVKTINVVSSDGQPFLVTYQQTWWVDSFGDEEIKGEKKELKKKVQGKNEDENGKEDEAGVEGEKSEIDKDKDQQGWRKIVSMMLKGKFLELYKKQRGTKKRIKKGKAIKAATRISDERKAEETEEQAFERHASGNVELETEATVTSILGGHNTDDLKKQKECAIFCPDCNSLINSEDDQCKNTGKNCRWTKTDTNIPKDFKARLGWLTTVRLDKSLSDRFGIGCDLKLSNITPPEDLQKALLDQQVFEIKKDIAKKQGEAVESKLEGEAKGYQHLSGAGISPNVAFTIGKLADVVHDISDTLKKPPAQKAAQKEGGEKK